MEANAFIDKTYDDAIALLVEARNYAAYVQPREEEQMPADLRMTTSFQSLKVTSRLTEVMAWLLAKRAVESGEMTPGEFLDPRWSLPMDGICTSEEGEGDEHLPDALRSLLQRSYSLYLRVARLDGMYRVEAPGIAE